MEGKGLLGKVASPKSQGSGSARTSWKGFIAGVFFLLFVFAFVASMFRLNALDENASRNPFGDSNSLKSYSEAWLHNFRVP